MSFNPAAIQARSYHIETPIYEGPLDLLLQLIERAELDITKLALAQVTDQYLSHLKNLSERSAEEVSAFLVIAARLLQIKSEALLPRPPAREPGEEDPGEALAQQLILYRRYRQVSDILQAREESGLRTYLRVAPPLRIEGNLDLSGIGINDLVNAASALYAELQRRKAGILNLAPPRITIREKITLIAQTLRRLHHAKFQTLLKEQTDRVEIVVTFLAMLELVKRRLVQARQQRLFGEIEIESTENLRENQEFELEFGE
jgi:segregation and condensation protein A